MAVQAVIAVNGTVMNLRRCGAGERKSEAASLNPVDWKIQKGMISLQPLFLGDVHTSYWTFWLIDKWDILSIFLGLYF